MSRPSNQKEADKGTARHREELAGLIADLAAHIAWRSSMGRARVPAAGPGPVSMVAGAEAEEPASGGQPPLQVAVEAPSLPAASTPAPETEPPVTIIDPAGRLDEIRRELGECTRCMLAASRKNIVFGVGNPRSSLVFVGEGPGADEDAKGEPFVGKAGELLDKMIVAMRFRREDVYICNVVKCRPPKNRDPKPDEVEVCEPFLKAQLAAIRPKVIVGLGRCAVGCLLGKPDLGITKVRGKWTSYEGIDMMPTYHPAYLLRDPAAKKDAWTDLKAVMARLERQVQ